LLDCQCCCAELTILECAAGDNIAVVFLFALAGVGEPSLQNGVARSANSKRRER
jgi:hypothetical protein